MSNFHDLIYESFYSLFSPDINHPHMIHIDLISHTCPDDL